MGQSLSNGEDYATMRTCLEVRDVTKSFPGVLANDHVNFDVREGEIHAILGENGAGKSTLVKIIYGLYKPDSGSIRFYDQELNFASPRQAIQAGIGMVHQHFMLIPALTVAENVVLGGEPGRIHGQVTREQLGLLMTGVDLKEEG